MNSPRIALVTAQAARDLDEDLPPLLTALRGLGADAHVAVWDDPDMDWTRFDLAVLRSTWDYTLRLAEFLDWAQRTAAQTRLLNPLSAVRWNTDKHYLRDLAAAGVATVPSEFLEPSEPAAAAIERLLATHADPEFVVKPAVGAGSRDAQRYARDESAAAIAHAQRLQQAGRSVLLQPYLDRVDIHGETALIFFHGRFSHAIRKGPLLRRGEGSTRALFTPEHITSREASAAELELAQRALGAAPASPTFPYARVDLIHDASGTPCVLELELTEPSLFFDHAPGTAARFASVLLTEARGEMQADTTAVSAD